MFAFLIVPSAMVYESVSNLSPFGEANLTEDGKAVVDALASFSRSSHGTRIDIVGNTDTAEADPVKLGM